MPTYKAILRDNCPESRGSGRQHPPANRPVAVYITVVDEPLGEVDAGEKGQGARMAAALEQLAEIQALTDINDAATWEREMRQERALPGRDAGC